MQTVDQRKPDKRRGRLDLGEHYSGRDRREDHAANGEQGDSSRRERRRLTTLKCPSKRPMATGSDDEQRDCEHRVAAPEHDVRCRGGVKQARRKPADAESPRRSDQGRAPPRQPGPFSGHGDVERRVSIYGLRAALPHSGDPPTRRCRRAS